MSPILKNPGFYNSAGITNRVVTSEVTKVINSLYCHNTNTKVLKAMLDTCKLNITDCVISDKTPLIIEPNKYDHSTNQKIADYELFVDSKGEIVKGKRAYINHKFFNLTILPSPNVTTPGGLTKSSWIEVKKNGNQITAVNKIKKNHSMNIEDNNSNIFLQFSFPKFRKESNINPLKKIEHYDVIDFLNKELKDLGIKTNLYDADLSRLDSFTNLKTDESFNQYTPIFDLLNLSRKKSIEWNGQTFLWRSGEQQITIYDKIAEMFSKLKDEKFLQSFKDRNILRIENRLTTKRKIFAKYGFKNVLTMLENMDLVRNEYKTDINNSIFKYESNQIEYLTAESITRSLENFLNSGSRYWFRNFLVYNGYLSLIRLTSPEIIIECIDKMNITGSESRCRKLKSRIRKQFNEAKTGYFLNQKSIFDSSKSYKQLYNELKTKFSKAA